MQYRYASIYIYRHLYIYMYLEYQESRHWSLVHMHLGLALLNLGFEGVKLGTPASALHPAHIYIPSQYKHPIWNHNPLSPWYLS